MTDDDFVRAFLDGSLPPGQFHHRDHLRLAWCLVRQRGAEEAMRTITGGIQRFAAQHGQASKYHETLTQFWVRIVAHMVEVRPDLDAFDAFLAAFPLLLDKELPYRHWRRETMASMDARAQWVAPDLLALPPAGVRAALASFATGVAIVTTASEGRPYGLAVSAYVPVALEPPLVLVSLARSSQTYKRILRSGSYAVNVLKAEQEALARRFASRTAKTFADLTWRPGATGSPLLSDALATIECRVEAEYPGGDHALLLGTIIRWEGSAAARGGQPLVYYDAEYRALQPTTLVTS